MTKLKKLVILGDGAFAELAYEYFTHDSEYEVLGFAVEQAFITRQSLFNLPVMAFESLENSFDPETTFFYAALVYNQLNRLRERLFLVAKAKGFKPASYISSRAFIWHNVEIGEHCFIFEDNTVQPFVKIGDNNILWSGNHIGHHSLLGNHCFIASHVVISGFCEVADHVFIGVNATIANNIKIAEDNWIGPSVTILKDTEANLIFKGEQPEPAKISATRFFKVAKTI